MCIANECTYTIWANYHQPAAEAVESLVELVTGDPPANETVVVYLLSEVLSGARDINNTEEFSQVSTHHRLTSLLFILCVHCTECAGGGRWSDE